jgi:endoglucanase
VKHIFYLVAIIFISYAGKVEENPILGGDDPKDQKLTQFQFGDLHVQGSQLMDKNNNPVILRGVSYGWHNWWPRFYNEKSVKWLKQNWKINMVRAAMGVEPDGAYLSRPSWSKEKVKAIVDAAIAEDLYVIIDWHSHNILLEDAKSFFSEMALLYGDHPNVIYEIFNEPQEQSWSEVKAYSIEVIKAIRQHDPDNIILIGSPHWCQDVHIVADNPITGYENLMYTLHFYAGSHKQSLRDRADYALGKKLPLFVSECASMDATGDGPIDEASWNTWVNWMEERKISWAVWSVADKNETCSMLLPNASDYGNWAESDLKPWAKIARRDIIKRN